MNIIDKAVVFLDSFDFATYRKKQLFFDMLKTPEQIFDVNVLKSNKNHILEIFSDDEYQILLNAISCHNEELIDKNFEKLGINAISIYSSDYPENLKNIDTPPFVIYYKGDLSLLKSNNCFAIVGSRHITNYGKQATEKFARDLCQSGFVIVSGLASGVDTVAHSTTLAEKGKTIAVLAGGLDEIYPSTNTNLAKEIVEKDGLLITETRPYKRTESYMFPIRNRIIAALSRGVLITEAQEKSGVIHTKNYALDYGKDVFAVPGSIFSSTSVGSNQMIINGQAKAVSCVQDILDEYNIKFSPKPRVVENFSINDALIINALENGPKAFQELVELTKLEVKTLNTLLTTLLIRGIIKKLAGNVYYLAK